LILVSFFFLLSSFRVKDSSGKPAAQRGLETDSLTAANNAVLEWDVDPPARPDN